MAAEAEVPKVPVLDFKFSKCTKKERREIFSAVIKFKYKSEAKYKDFRHPYDGDDFKYFQTEIDRDIGIFFLLFIPTYFLFIYLSIYIQLFLNGNVSTSILRSTGALCCCLPRLRPLHLHLFQIYQPHPKRKLLVAGVRRGKGVEASLRRILELQLP